METARTATGGFELVMVERDDRQAIYETWVALNQLNHGFHRYEITTGECTRIDKGRPTSCDMSIAQRIAGVITRAYREQGNLPERICRNYW